MMRLPLVFVEGSGSTLHFCIVGVPENALIALIDHGIESRRSPNAFSGVTRGRKSGEHPPPGPVRGCRQVLQSHHRGRNGDVQ